MDLELQTLRSEKKKCIFLYHVIHQLFLLLGDTKKLQVLFGGAPSHKIFNIFCIIILLPELLVWKANGFHLLLISGKILLEDEM